MYPCDGTNTTVFDTKPIAGSRATLIACSAVVADHFGIPADVDAARRDSQFVMSVSYEHYEGEPLFDVVFMQYHDKLPNLSRALTIKGCRHIEERFRGLA